MDRALVAAAATSAAGLVLLAGLSVLSEPPDVPIGSVGRYEGQTVCVTGRLLASRPIEDAAALTLQAGNRSLALFSHVPVSAIPGDAIRACGNVQRTPRGYLLRVVEPNAFTVQAHWHKEATALVVLAEAPWDFRDQHVLTAGRLVDEGSRTYLTDGLSGARLRAIAPSGYARQGESRYGGVVEYDSERSSFHLRIETQEP